jgi:hypothetical protein
MNLYKFCGNGKVDHILNKVPCYKDIHCLIKHHAMEMYVDLEV